MRALAVLVLCFSSLLAACGGADDAAPAEGTPVHTVAGTVSGLDGTLVLRSGAIELTITANGSFSATVTRGIAYDVEVVSHPVGQTCTVVNGKGTVERDISNVAVTCAANAPGMPSVPAGLTATYGVKSFNFTWEPSAAAGSYRLMEDPDGAGPLPAVLAGTSTTASFGHPVASLLHTRLNARYTVEACNAAGCSAPSAAAAPDAVRAIGYFKSASPRSSDNFGGAIALSADGNTMAVGVVGEDSNAQGIGGDASNNLAPGSGAVYVFARSGGAWAQQAYVKAGNAQTGDSFGHSVALSADGNLLAVGATYEAGGSAGIDGPSNEDALGAGAVYLFGRSGGTWTQQAYVKSTLPVAGDAFGSAVALSADGLTLAVGAYSDGVAATGTYTVSPGGSEGGYDRGAVHVYSRPPAGAWAPQAYIKASNTGDNDYFGWAIALSANGDTLAVGAPSEGSDARGIGGDQANENAMYSGAVYMFARAAGTWSQQAYIKSSNSDAFDQFGYSLALSADGSTLAAGAFGESASGAGDEADNSANSSGAVYVFSREPGSWVQQAYVKAATVGPSDFFGMNVALSADGMTLAAGAMWEDGSGTSLAGDPADNAASNAGAAYVFTFSAGTWSQQRYIKATNAGTQDSFGAIIALSGDGTTLAVGAPLERSNSPGINGDASNNSASGAGAVYLY
jgi:hypothetical protein